MSSSGHDLHLAEDLTVGLKSLKQTEPDLVLLEGGHTDDDTVAFCEKVRRSRDRRASTAIVVSIDKGDADRRVRLLDAGADDVIDSQQSSKERLARIWSACRRQSMIDSLYRSQARLKSAMKGFPD